MEQFLEYIKYFSLTIFGGILGYLIRILIEHRLAIDRDKENIKLTEHKKAASKFKSIVINELSGFYPIDQLWNKKHFSRIYESIPRINSAAAEFSSFVNRKTDFDKAVSEYNTYCRETTYDSVSADSMYPNMRKEGQIGKREQFKNIVERLLSFAD